MPGAAPYAGAVHPLLVVDGTEISGSIDFNRGFPYTPWSWPGPIQLVICLDRGDPKKIASCGAYKGADGAVYEAFRGQDRVTVRVLIASTGKSIRKTTLTNPAPTCPKTFLYGANDDWILTDDVTNEQISSFAANVSKQAVK